MRASEPAPSSSTPFRSGGARCADGTLADRRVSSLVAQEGTHLGTIVTTEATSNVAFGDDGSTLYITADTYLLRVRPTSVGAGFRD